MKIFKLLGLPIFFLSCFSLTAQLSKGMLRMEVNGIKMNGEDAPAEMATHLGNMDISVFSNGILQKSVMSMMMMKTTTILDTKLDSIHIYMDMMGKKYKVSESRKSMLENKDEKIKVANDEMELKEFPEDVKEILGFKCHRVLLKMKVPNPKSSEADPDAEIQMNMYVTKDLHFDPSYLTQTSKKIRIDGTPLEYNMSLGSGTFKLDILMLAKEYKKDIVVDDLLPPPGEFKTYTMEQFQNEMGGGKRR